MKKPNTLKFALKNKLTKKQLAIAPTSFDTVGDLAIFADFPKELKKKEKLIGETLIEINPQVNVVLKKTKKYSVLFFVDDILFKHLSCKCCHLATRYSAAHTILKTIYEFIKGFFHLV